MAPFATGEATYQVVRIGEVGVQGLVPEFILGELGEADVVAALE